jgi:MFS family permease
MSAEHTGATVRRWFGCSTRDFLRDKFEGLPRSYWVLWGGTLVNRLGTMVQPFFAFYLTGSRGLSLAATGVVLAVFGAGTLVSQLMAGWLADRFGRRVTLAGGMLFTAVLMLVLAYSTALLVIACCMFLLGVAIDVYRPASNALVADVIPMAQRARAYGLLFWAVNLGFTGGVLTGGLLASVDIKLLFWIDALTCVIFGFMVWFAVPESHRHRRGNLDAGSFGDVLRDRLMIAFTLVTAAYGLVYLQSLLTLPLAMKLTGLPSWAYGAAMAGNGIVIVIVQPLLVNWLGRRDHSRVVAAGMALVGVGFGLTTFASSLLGYLGTVVVWSIGEIAFTGVSTTIVANLAPAHLRGRYSGVYGFAWSVSFLVAPLLGTALLGHGAATLWLACAAIGVLAASGQVLLGPAIRRRTTAGVVNHV